MGGIEDKAINTNVRGVMLDGNENLFIYTFNILGNVTCVSINNTLASCAIFIY